MFDLDHWREIYGALVRNKLRTCLTAFGVFWGIFFLMVMLGAGTGLENGVQRGFAGAATNSFFVWTQRTSKPYRGLPSGRSFEMDNGDVVALRRQLPEVEIVAPRNQLGGYRGGNNVVRGKRTGAFSIMGDYPEVARIQAVPIEAGRFLNRLDIEDRRKVAVIGSRVRTVLFEPTENPIGDHIQIKGVYFKVVGTFRSQRSGEDADRDGQTIYVPFTTFQQAFNYGDRVGWLAVTSRGDVPATVAQKRVVALLAQRHRVDPDDRRAFGSWNMGEEYGKIQGLFTGIRTLTWIVGIGTLLAGTIGVSNIMLIIVRERTRELGIRRALGATPLAVMGQVILEAILLTTTAGYGGLILGMLGLDGVRYMMNSAGVKAEMFADPGVKLASALTALAVLIVCGTLAGIIPAQRAVRIRPVEALRA